MAFFSGLLVILGCTGADPSAGTTDSGNNSVQSPTETPRRVLHEMFTGSTCGPCLEADEILHAVLDENPEDVTHISYQIGSDPYITQEGVSRRMGYLPADAGSYSIPYLHVDGGDGLHPVEYNKDEGYQQSDFEGFLAATAVVELTASHSVVDQSIDVVVDVLPLAEVAGEDLHLHVAIIEGVTTLNVGTNGQKEFHHVMKKMLPDADGTPIVLVSGEAQSFDFSYTFQGDYTAETTLYEPVDHDTEHTVEEFDDLSVVVFVQDSETWAVHQSVWSGAGH